MAQRPYSLEPGDDYIDDSISRLKAAKTALGALLARAFGSVRARFLVLGSALATVEARTTELEHRHNIDWPALDGRLAGVETALTNQSPMAREVPRHSTLLEALEERLRLTSEFQQAISDRLVKIESQARGDMTSLQALVGRLQAVEAMVNDGALRTGMRDLSGQRSTALLLHAAAELLSPTPALPHQNIFNPYRPRRGPHRPEDAPAVSPGDGT